MRTAEEYLAGLRDGREVWYRGERVPDVVEHPELGVGARHAALDFEFAEDPENRALAVTDGHSTYYHLPRDASDLRRRSLLIESSTAFADTLVILVKEIGTDALFALHRVTHGTDWYGRVEAYHRHCREGDLALAVAQTDVKGDRSKGPSGQVDPDLYVHVVDRRPDGVVVRGAKVHTTSCPNVDEVIVIPTRALKPGEEDWAIAFALPVATPGCEAVRLRLHARRPRPVDAAGLAPPQADGDPDGLRRRLRSERADLPRRRPRAGRTAGARVRRVPPLHRRLLQAPARRRVRRAGDAARRGERDPARLPRARQAGARSSGTRRRCAGSRTWPPTAAAWTGRRGSPTRTR